MGESLPKGKDEDANSARFALTPDFFKIKEAYGSVLNQLGYFSSQKLEGKRFQELLFKEDESIFNKCLEDCINPSRAIFGLFQHENRKVGFGLSAGIRRSDNVFSHYDLRVWLKKSEVKSRAEKPRIIEVEIKLEPPRALPLPLEMQVLRFPSIMTEDEFYNITKEMEKVMTSPKSHKLYGIRVSSIKNIDYSMADTLSSLLNYQKVKLVGVAELEARPYTYFRIANADKSMREKLGFADPFYFKINKT